MKCQISGCSQQAVNEVEGYVFHGLHICTLNYCNKHSFEEIEKYKLQEFEKHSQCDTMKDAKALIRRKTYEVGKAAG